jgi:hypothetical protein
LHQNRGRLPKSGLLFCSAGAGKGVASINKLVKSAIVMLAVVVFLTGCGGNNFIASNYSLEDVVTDDRQNTSKVYRAENKAVPEVANILAKQEQPKEISKEDPERMFLVYNDRLIQVMRDAQQPADSLIEVSEKEFVRNNYNTSFLEAYLMYSIVDSLFGMGGRRQGGYGGYVGENGRYSKNTGAGGSIRYGSIRGTNPRGGGPGVGK